MKGRGYCLHTCSCRTEAACPHWRCGCEDEHWREDCPHVTPCKSATECERRAEECACVEPHEDPNECAPYQRENPPDVDVRTEIDD